MPALLIKDFLQTQGLKLDTDHLHAAYLAARAVMDMGRASIERNILWHEDENLKLSEHIADTPENEAVLKQVFMALDSAFSRAANVKSAAVYALMPSESGLRLVCITQQGRGLEKQIAVNEENSLVHLPSRTAQSGWMNIADDVAYWMEIGEMAGGRNADSKAQMSVPVAGINGRVYGVVHVEFENKKQIDETAQTEWSALTLALIEPLKTLLGIVDEDEADE